MDARGRKHLYLFAALTHSVSPLTHSLSPLTHSPSPLSHSYPIQGYSCIRVRTDCVHPSLTLFIMSSQTRPCLRARAVIM
jgi:hypothetical protein